MKKLTAFLVLCLLALPVFAQRPASTTPSTPSPASLLSSVVFTAEDGLFSINLLDHVFLGYNIVDSDDFTPHGGGELAINTLALNFAPLDYVNFQVGMDCKWLFFSTRDSRFYLDRQKMPQVTIWPRDEKPATTEQKPEGSSTEGQNPSQAQSQTQEPDPFELPDETKIGKQRSALHTFSLTIPVLATVHLNDYFWISAGAEANLNLTSWTNFTLETGDVTESSSVTDGQVRPFTFDFVGMAGFRDVALFFKYYPKTSRIVPDGGVQFDYCALGVTLFL